ncbi:hypothetical protein PoB_003522600 [Plakobranchus ocellatus]|uniref:C-type lectin domain-containing protein n=1 Tax=Plakobranchus ocellatus TaxID=259542 RepID=A0AAV4AK96_9GAST|nr:hypothetical protein PoB_003522600 [Plakobranchus ocellatus]
MFNKNKFRIRDVQYKLFMTNKSETTYSNWARGHHNNLKFHLTNEGQGCAELIDKWNDESCPRQQAFICERPPRSAARKGWPVESSASKVGSRTSQTHTNTFTQEYFSQPSVISSAISTKASLTYCVSRSPVQRVSVAQWIANLPRDLHGPFCRGFGSSNRRPGLTESLEAEINLLWTGYIQTTNKSLFKEVRLSYSVIM